MIYKVPDPDLLQKTARLIENDDHRGPFDLFAAVLRPEAHGYWSLVVAAPWVMVDVYETVFLITERLSDVFDDNALIHLSGIVTLEPDDPFVRAVIDTVGAVSQKPRVVRHESLGGIDVLEMWVIASRKRRKRQAA